MDASKTGIIRNILCSVGLHASRRPRFAPLLALVTISVVASVGSAVTARPLLAVATRISPFLKGLSIARVPAGGCELQFYDLEKLARAASGTFGLGLFARRGVFVTADPLHHDFLIVAPGARASRSYSTMYKYDPTKGLVTDQRRLGWYLLPNPDYPVASVSGDGKIWTWGDWKRSGHCLRVVSPNGRTMLGQYSLPQKYLMFSFQVMSNYGLVFPQRYPPQRDLIIIAVQENGHSRTTQLATKAGGEMKFSAVDGGDLYGMSAMGWFVRMLASPRGRISQFRETRLALPNSRDRVQAFAMLGRGSAVAEIAEFSEAGGGPEFRLVKFSVKTGKVIASSSAVAFGPNMVVWKHDIFVVRNSGSVDVYDSKLKRTFHQPTAISLLSVSGLAGGRAVRPARESEAR